MTKPTKREYLAQGKGVLNAAGPQSRFILFLIIVLVLYTLLLKIFQKLAAIVELPVFLPIALLSLLVFIGIAGTVYSHRFVGPVTRIRKALERIAEGECSISLRLRESDDPMMKELVETIGHLCERSRHAHQLVRDTSRELSCELAALEEEMRRGSAAGDLADRWSVIREKQSLLDRAIRSLGS